MTTLEKLRLKIGDSVAPYTFSDDELNSIITDNTDSNEKITLTQSAIECIKILLVNSAKQFNYKQGNSSVNKGDVFDNLKGILEVFENELVDLNDGDITSLVDRTTEDDMTLNDIGKRVETDISRYWEGYL